MQIAESSVIGPIQSDQPNTSFVRGIQGHRTELNSQKLKLWSLAFRVQKGNFLCSIPEQAVGLRRWALNLMIAHSCAACDDWRRWGRRNVAAVPCRCMSFKSLSSSLKFRRFQHNPSQHQSNLYTGEDLAPANHIFENFALPLMMMSLLVTDYRNVDPRFELPQKRKVIIQSLGDQWCIIFSLFKACVCR